MKELKDFDRAFSAWKWCVVSLGSLLAVSLIFEAIEPHWLRGLVGWERENPIMLLALMASACVGWIVGFFKHRAK